VSEAKGISLARAALELRRGYWQTRDLILRGELKGWLDSRERWMVDPDDVQRMIQERQSAAA
jgi:hypothetical protein